MSALAREISWLAPITEANVAGNVIVKAGKHSQWRGVDRDKSAVTDEVTRSNIKDHDPAELQTTVGLLVRSARKETGRSFRVDEFGPQILNFAGKYFRCLNSQKDRVRPEFGGMLFPVFAGALLGEPNLIRSRIVGVDSEVAIINSFCAHRKQRHKEKSNG
jgi:hypothetical protein